MINQIEEPAEQLLDKKDIKIAHIAIILVESCIILFILLFFGYRTWVNHIHSYRLRDMYNLKRQQVKQ